MQTITQLLDEYGDSHRNMFNKLIHWICVPAIFWSLVAITWVIPFPDKLEFMSVPLNWAIVSIVLLQIYYFKLSVPLALGFMVVNFAMLMLTIYVESISPWPLWQVAVAVFVVAWIGQFIGHAVEGKRPSFFKDLQFLLIGPAWLLGAAYRSIGLKY
jgi:uncharacterized membrane protein YGL010W